MRFSLANPRSWGCEMKPSDQPLTQDEERARERLNRRLEPYGKAVVESFRGDALIAAAQIFGLDPDQSNEPKDEAVGLDPSQQTVDTK